MSSHLDGHAPPYDTAPPSPDETSLDDATLPHYTSWDDTLPPYGPHTVRAVSSHTNQWMARGFADGTIILTDMTNQSTTCVQRANGKPISALAFSPKEPLRLACAHSNGHLTAWSIQSNQINEIKHLPPDRECRGFPPTGVENIRALAWSPDTTQILVCYEYGYLFGWSPISGGQNFRWLCTGSALPITFAVFSPDSRFLAYHRTDGLCHIGTSSNGPRRRRSHPIPGAQSSAPDSKPLLAAAS